MGSIFVGSTVRFGPTALGQKEAYELVQRFAKQTIAYVDPSDKSSSVLDRDHLTSQVKWEFVAGFFLILLAHSFSMLSAAFEGDSIRTLSHPKFYE